MNSVSNEFDLIIIGSGPGGYIAAIRASQLGMRVCVVEKAEIGGVCLNWGCIPTKVLLRNAEVIGLFNRAREFGITVEGFHPDFRAAIARSRRAASRLSKGVNYLLKKNNVTHISGSARLANKKYVEVFNEQGISIGKYHGKNILIATGGRPKSIPGLEIDEKAILSSSGALIQDEPPSSMAIIGAGAVGVEFAFIYSMYDTKVTLIEMLPHIIPYADKEIAAILTRSFKKQGIEIFTEARVEEVTKGNNDVSLKISGGNGSLVIESEKVLVAVGRRANSEDLGLEDLGINTDKGFIQTDSHFQTTVPGIFAIGDVAGEPLLAHKASEEGKLTVEAISGFSESPIAPLENIPVCTYTHPEVASIGLTEDAAKEKGYEIKIGRFPFRANGKAVCIGEEEGLVKVISEAESGEIIGVHIIGASATELIAEISVAKRLKTSVMQLGTITHAHPTLSEAIMESALDTVGRAIHI